MGPEDVYQRLVGKDIEDGKVEKASEFELGTTSWYVLYLYIYAKLDDSLHKILLEHIIFEKNKRIHHPTVDY
jgi:hypothetical protein